MTEQHLKGRSIGILAEHDFEDLELHYPLHRLAEEGADVRVVAPEMANYRGKHGTSILAQDSLEAVRADQFDALVLPGGYCPDHLRTRPAAIKLIKTMHAAGKPIAAICHAAWLLCSADLLRDRRVTCFSSIQDDVINAGGRYRDEPVVVDGNLITSRFPADLGVFCRAIIKALAS